MKAWLTLLGMVSDRLTYWAWSIDLYRYRKGGQSERVEYDKRWGGKAPGAVFSAQEPDRFKRDRKKAA